MSWHVSPWVYPVWNSLCLLDLIDYLLFHVGEIFNHNLFKSFLIPFLFLFFHWDPYNLNWSSDNIKCCLGCGARGTLTHFFCVCVCVCVCMCVLPIVSLVHSILHEEASHQVHQTRVSKAKGLCLLLSLSPCAEASGWVLNALFIKPSSPSLKLFSKWLWCDWSFHPGSHTMIATTTSQY